MRLFAKSKHSSLLVRRISEGKRLRDWHQEDYEENSDDYNNESNDHNDNSLAGPTNVDQVLMLKNFVQP
jgi:hypothetical protein